MSCSGRPRLQTRPSGPMWRFCAANGEGRLLLSLLPRVPVSRVRTEPVVRQAHPIDDAAVYRLFG